MMTDVTTLKDGKKVDVEEKRLWKPLILLYQKGLLLIENGRNLRYSARDGCLKLAREPRLFRLLGFKVNCGCLVKEDFATSGGYSVVLDNLKCPNFCVCLNYDTCNLNVSNLRILMTLLKGPCRS